MNGGPGIQPENGSRDGRLVAALSAFESIHHEDARSVTIEGEVTPRSVHYHRRLLHWMLHFEPEPSVALRLAAACQHVRRWTIPRSTYEQGRVGYRQWRTDLSRVHVEIASGVLEEAGYDEETIARVRALLLKTGLKRDREVQLFENAICMVFLENDFGALAAKNSDEKMIDVLRRTLRKMSGPGRSAALALADDLTESERSLLHRASST